MEVADLECDARRIIVKCEWHSTGDGVTNNENFDHEGE